MILHYINIAFRTFSRSKAYSVINLLGLTLGIACSIVILLFVYDELTFDHHHKNINTIYRLNGGWRSMHDETSQMYTNVGYNEGDVLKRDFPEVDKVVRIRRFWDCRIEKPQSNEFYTEHIYAVEPEVFNVFTFPFIAGNPATSLSDYNSVVITQKAATKYFGSQDVLGKTMRWIGQDTVELKVTGLINDYPDNTQFKTDIIIAIKPTTDMRREWFEYGYYTFFTLHPDAKISSVASKIKHFTKKDVADVENEIGFIAEHEIIPMADIHLHSTLAGELEANFKASYVYTFLIVGIFILVMACINFMNLATARSMTRAREIGVRKVMGALKQQLMRQFLGEAFLVTALSAILSILLVYLIIPVINDFTGKKLEIFNQTQFWVMLVSVVVLVTLLAGFYPALFLSGFKPAETLKGSFKRSDKGAFLRKGLVVFQFTISIALIAGVLIVSGHINFMRTKDLGFNKEKVLVVPGAKPIMKEQLLGIAGIESVAFSNRVPGYSLGGRTIIVGASKSDKQVVMGQLAVDHDFVNLYGLELRAGRSFDKNITSDQTEAFVINEAAMRLIGFNSAEQAIGQPLWLQEDWGGKKGTIVGVLKDFHFIGVNADIEPFSMFLHPAATRFMSVKISSSNLQEIVKKIEAVYVNNVEGAPFSYNFIDQEFDKQYQAEERFMTIFSVFATLAILIACLGSYGLANFVTEQRTKEVGVRKVLGASVSSILALLMIDFIRFVIVAFGIAVPLSYFGMEKWLSTFPFRENIDPTLFVFTGILVLLITAVTIGYQAFQTATTNPVKTLRAE